jgi:hypothetical protein
MLLHRLRDAGWPIETNRLLPEEAAAEIVQAWADTRRRSAAANGSLQPSRTPEEEP